MAAERAGEFDLIARYFKPLATSAAARGLDDDAAVLDLEPGRSLVVTTDTVTEGVHFLPATAPADVAWKALAVNLSDLAAMGAAPLGYTLALSLSDATDDAWVAAFARGLETGQGTFGLSLLGGDTTATPGPLSIGVTMLGAVQQGRAVHRAGAKPGDALCVTGTVGDGALGLLAETGTLGGLDAGHAAHLGERYRRPEPRLGLLAATDGRVHACADVSDGLVADAGHIAEASGVRIAMDRDAVPLSNAARAALDADAALWPAVLSGGDDYELLIALDPGDVGELRARAQSLGIAATVVGRVEAGQGVCVVDAAGAEIALERTGWRHR